MRTQASCFSKGSTRQREEPELAARAATSPPQPHIRSTEEVTP